MAVLHHPVDGCVKLSGPSPTDNAQLKEIQNLTKDVGVKVQYTGGDPAYDFSVEIYCDKVDFQTINATYVVVGDKTQITYRFKSRVGCKYDQLSKIWDWFQSNRWAMFAFLAVVGFTLCFFGRALVKPTLFLLGIFIATLVIMYIFYSTFLKTDTETWVAWTVLGGSVIVGLILGFIFQKFAKVGAFALAGWGGFTLGMILYSAFMYKFIGGSLAG